MQLGKGLPDRLVEHAGIVEPHRANDEPAGLDKLRKIKRLRVHATLFALAYSSNKPRDR